MNKSKLIVMLCIVMLLCIPLTFVSLLGENNHANTLIQDYFKQVQQENFAGSCLPIKIADKAENKPVISSEISTLNTTSENDCANNNFVFVLTLLDHFSLLEESDYVVNIERDNFWLPWLTNDEVTVSINLISRKVLESQGLFEKHNYINQLLVVQRDGLTWRIKEARLNTPELITRFTQYKNNLDFEKYLAKTATGYQFKPVSIDISDMTAVEKKLLKFNLQKLEKIVK